MERNPSDECWKSTIHMVIVIEDVATQSPAVAIWGKFANNKKLRNSDDGAVLLFYDGLCCGLIGRSEWNTQIQIQNTEKRQIHKDRENPFDDGTVFFMEYVAAWSGGCGRVRKYTNAKKGKYIKRRKIHGNDGAVLFCFMIDDVAAWSGGCGRVYSCLKAQTRCYGRLKSP